MHMSVCMHHAHVCVHASRKIRGKGVWGHGHASTLNFWILCANRWCNQVIDFIQPQHWHTAFLRTSVQSIDATRGSRGMLPKIFLTSQVGPEALTLVLSHYHPYWIGSIYDQWLCLSDGQVLISGSILDDHRSKKAPNSKFPHYQ